MNFISIKDHIINVDQIRSIVRVIVADQYFIYVYYKDENQDIIYYGDDLDRRENDFKKVERQLTIELKE